MTSYTFFKWDVYLYVSYFDFHYISSHLFKQNKIPKRIFVKMGEESIHFFWNGVPRQQLQDLSLPASSATYERLLEVISKFRDPRDVSRPILCESILLFFTRKLI
jgi:hypothetical protein